MDSSIFSNIVVEVDSPLAAKDVQRVQPVSGNGVKGIPTEKQPTLWQRYWYLVPIAFIVLSLSSSANNAADRATGSEAPAVNT